MDRPTARERSERFRRFLEGRCTGGPLMGFFFESYYPLRRYRAARRLPPGEYRPDVLAVEEFAADYERLYALHEAHAGDFLWTGSAFWGVPWVEALAGCAVVADQGTGSCRSLPREDVRSADDIPCFDTANTWAAKALEFVDALVRWSAGRYPLGTTLMRGMADALSALHGNPDFIFRLLDDPAGQWSIIDRVARIWTAFAEAQLERIPAFCGGVGAFFYNCWLPGRGVALQDDAVALLSPELYRELILPAQRRIIGAFDSCLYHMHPSSFMPIRELCETDISVLELHVDVGGPGVRDLLPAYLQIQERKPLLIWGELQMDDVKYLVQKLDRRSLALNIVVPDEERAEEMWRRFGG